MNALVLAPFSDQGLAALVSLGSVTYEPWTETRRLHDPEELGIRLAAQGFDTLIVEADFLFDELFQAPASLRFAAICRSALNQVDLDAATERGVVVVHTPGRNAEAVAELVLGLMLSLARGIPASSAYLASGAWEDPTEPYTRFQGRELAGSTLGVIGLGQIGRRVAGLGRGVGMRVLAYDPYVVPGSRGAAGLTLVGLDELLAHSDFVSIHVPETPETIGMVGARELALMGPTAYLVNVTSEAVVDAKALAAALSGRAIAGAAMDVHEAHPIPPNSPFIGMDNALLTPHVGGATVESIKRHSSMVIADLSRFLSGRRPKHLANPKVWARRRR